MVRHAWRLFRIGCWSLWTVLLAPLGAQTVEPVRIGVIGLESDRGEQLAMRLNDPANPNHVPGGRLVMAFAGGDTEAHQKHAAVLKDQYGVRLAETVTELTAEVDAVMILRGAQGSSPDLAVEAMTSDKPLFVDSPIGGDLSKVVEVYESASRLKVPLMSCGDAMWIPGIQEVIQSQEAAPESAIAWGGGSLGAPGDAFSAGIATVEALFDLMGPGCASVQASPRGLAASVSGSWPPGRLGTLHLVAALNPEGGGCEVVRFDGEQMLHQGGENDLTPWLREILEFFRSKQSPIPVRQALEGYGFVEAARASSTKNGQAVWVRQMLLDAGADEGLWPLPSPEVPAEE